MERSWLSLNNKSQIHSITREPESQSGKTSLPLTGLDLLPNTLSRDFFQLSMLSYLDVTDLNLLSFSMLKLHRTTTGNPKHNTFLHLPRIYDRGLNCMGIALGYNPNVEEYLQLLHADVCPPLCTMCSIFLGVDLC